MADLEQAPARSDSSRDRQEFDPITFSVILSRFNAIAEEMTRTYEATAWSSIIALGRDFSCAIYDAVPRQLCMRDAIPIHTTSMHLVLEAISDAFAGEIREGDVYLCNAPYRSNTHVGDVVTAEPVFTGGRHLLWSCTKGHQLDIGAYIPASVVPSARDVWQEGLQIPPLKIYDRGQPRSDVIDLYLSNLRYRDVLRGDLLAQIGSIGKGRTRLLELADEYGADVLMQYVDAIVDYADRRMSEEIQRIPDGRYGAEAWVDSDGTTNTNVPIRVAIDVAGDRVHVDYTGSAPQSPRGLNSTVATMQAAATNPFLCFVDPDIPHNHGCFSHITAYAPEGTMCNARFPASTSCATQTPTDVMHDVIHRALAEAIPDKVIAGGGRAANMPTFAGVDERTGESWSCMLFTGGGFGASNDTDGWPMYLTPGSMGGGKLLLIEQVELLYPLQIQHMEIEPDSMGFGEFIGGPGMRFVIQPTHGSVHVTTTGDGQLNPPFGVLGGTPGCGGGQWIEDLSSGRRRYVSTTAHFKVEMGELRGAVSTGGGGYGSPLDRDPERVRRDVRDGVISRAATAEVFGVILDTSLDPVIDRAATEARRAALSDVERPTIDPTRPGAATWLQENLREGDEYLLNPEAA
jgi:N-methylhydantoinase B